MHDYFERVRNHIEQRAGQEGYLTSALFQDIHRELHYEDEGQTEIQSKEEYENLANRAINSISRKKEFRIYDEVLAWQASILRDLSKDFYTIWDDYLNQNFFADDFFTDGSPCIRLEASCEKLGENPTEVYTALLEVKHILTRLCVSCNSVMDEMEKLWKLKHRSDENGVSNPFLEKRVEHEIQHTMLYKSILAFETLTKRCRENARYLAGSEHVLWMQPAIQLEAITHAFKAFLYCEYNEEPELVLNKWIDQVFPQTMDSGNPNPKRFGPIHREILGKLSQATQVLVAYQVRKEDSFTQRDNVLRPFLRESLESCKLEEIQKQSLVHGQEQASGSAL